jgi:hypothetical protein
MAKRKILSLPEIEPLGQYREWHVVITMPFKYINCGEKFMVMK